MARYKLKNWNDGLATSEEIMNTAKDVYKLGTSIQDRSRSEELGEAMAAIPESVTTESTVPTEQSKMLAEQSADFSDEPKAAIPGQGDPAMQGQGQGTGIPLQEQKIQEMTQRKKSVTTKDWSAWEQKVREAAGKMGPEAVQAAEAHIMKTQHDSFKKSAGQAMAAMQQGDLRTAKESLEEAYSNMPDGNRAEITVQGDQVVATTYDEETGEMVGQPMPLTMEDIGNTLTQLMDPAGWAQTMTATKAKAAEDAEKIRQFEITEGRLSSADADDLSVAERTAGVADRKLRLEELKNNQDIPYRASQIAKIEAEIVELGKASVRAETKLGLEADKITNQVNQFETTAAQSATKISNQASQAERSALLEESKQFDKQAQDAVTNALNDAKLMLEENKHSANVPKIEAQIKELEAKANYYNNGGTAAKSKTYFAKKDAIYQRLNTASASLQKAVEEYSKYERRGGDIPPSVAEQYKRETKKYQNMENELVALDKEYGPKPAAGVPDAAKPPEGSKQGGDGNWYNADGNVYDDAGKVLGQWSK